MVGVIFIMLTIGGVEGISRISRNLMHGLMNIFILIIIVHVPEITFFYLKGSITFTVNNLNIMIVAKVPLKLLKE